MSGFTAAVCSFFMWPWAAQASPQSMAQDAEVVYQDQNIRLSVPESPLAPNALQIEQKNGFVSVTQYSPSTERSVYTCIQKIARIWQAHGVSSFMTYGKEEKNIPFHWQVVPYPPQTGWRRLWNQMKVFSHISFGASKLSQDSRRNQAEEFKKEFDNDYFLLNPPSKDTKPSDPFCDSKVIEKQWVFEGKTVRVLYNYAPIVLGKGGLHFLIVPKEHRADFHEVTESEYVEAMTLSKRLIVYYKRKGYCTTYLFDKTGADAGQTVPHWHQHVVFTATKTQEILGKLKVFKNMLWGSSPLTPKKLEQRVRFLRRNLAAPLT